MRQKLQAYYEPSIRQLAALVGEGALPAGWLGSTSVSDAGALKIQPAR
jgi:hypothetical protein